MDTINQAISQLLGYAMQLCYLVFKNYGLAILLFTLLSKVILLPVSVWVQKNSIKMVRMQPEINLLKARYFGDGDRIAEEQDKIFKKEKYNPFASIIPLAIQITLLMGIINVIYHPLDYLLHMDSGLIAQLVAAVVAITGADPSASTIQLVVVGAIQSGIQLNGIQPEVLSAIQQLDLSFLGFDLAAIPSMTGGMNLWSPVIAGFSSWLLCMAQNRSSVLQSEQSNWNKYGMMVFSVLLSLYLGTFVPIGVAVYWTASNLLAIAQLYMLNAVINPRSYVDYDALEASRKELRELQSIGGKRKLFSHDPNAKRERTDYKRFFSIANKHLVFYSEKSGFYKYFQDVIEYLLEHTNVIIHYVTNDANDAIFEKAAQNPQIKAYYVGTKKIITLMMKMDADMVVMTTPDLQKYHIKRSLVKEDTEYLYMFHGMTSTHLAVREGAYDHFDTILCVGQHQINELRKTEEIYGLPSKNLVPCGYGLMDNLVREYEKQQRTEDNVKKILIAPSWQEDNILESCLDELLGQLLNKGNIVIVRPHPEFIKRFPQKMQKILDRYGKEFNEYFIVETDFSSNVTIFTADLVITDWSGIAYEFSFSTYKPSLFINTPMKIMNPEYKKIGIEPTDITLRDLVGVSVNLDEMDKLGEAVEQLFEDRGNYQNRIKQLRNDYLFNIGSSGEAGGKYIVSQLQQRVSQKMGG